MNKHFVLSVKDTEEDEGMPKGTLQGKATPKSHLVS